MNKTNKPPLTVPQLLLLEVDELVLQRPLLLLQHAVVDHVGVLQVLALRLDCCQFLGLLALVLRLAVYEALQLPLGIRQFMLEIRTGNTDNNETKTQR
jgi:hypothetical protein